MKKDIQPIVDIPPKPELKRDITWKDAFWLSCGVSLGAWTTIGGTASIALKMTWIVFLCSMIIGFCQSFTYAEITGLFPNKSGGIAVCGAMAWIRYSKLIAPLTTWCYWLTWAPILSIVSGLGTTFIVRLFPVHSWVRTWDIKLLNLHWLMPGLSIRISATWLIAVAFLLIVFVVQHFGAAKMAVFQKIISISAMVLLFGITLAPFIMGKIPLSNLYPLTSPSGAWDMNGWALIMAAMFIAGYSTYGIENSVCYVSELKDPQKDTIKSIFAAGILGLIAFTVQPIAVQGFLGQEGIVSAGIADGTGYAAVMANMVGGGRAIYIFVYIMFLYVVLTGIMTAMGGSARVMYQSSVDGLFPRYLSRVNKHGAPTAATWTVLIFNIILLSFSNYFFILIAANVCYMITTFIDINAGWIHRIDKKDAVRCFLTPTWLMVLGVILSYGNIAFIAAYAAKVEAGPIFSGIVWALVIIPVFLFRHYVTDQGKLPEHINADLDASSSATMGRKAGVLPYCALLGAVVLFFIVYSVLK